MKRESNRLQKQVEELRTELEKHRSEAKRWADRAKQLETQHGSVCVQLRQAEVNVELAQSELHECRSVADELRAELKHTEQRLAAAAA